MKMQRLVIVISLLFVISGATGLIYQIVWFRYLSLFLGNTTYAQTIVLATFMGGLAGGAFFWGRKADISRSPLTVYALLEMGIGAYCILYPFFIKLLRDLFIVGVQASGLSSDSVSVLGMKLVLSLVTLLPPTILMGGTLPILVKTLSRSLEDSGQNVAVLYFLNSFGAVIGALLGGFFLVPMIGLKVSMLSTGIINVVIGGIALLLARMSVRPDGVEQVAESGAEREFPGDQAGIALIVACGSGVAAMIYEIGWVRLLIPVFGSSTYSFSLMLIAFITGITIGSWIVSKVIARIKNLFAFLGACQAGVVVSLCATLPLYGRLPYYFVNLAQTLQRSESTYPLFMTLQFILIVVIMIVPTIFLGMTLPVASRIATRSVAIMGKSVGNVFSINTLGTVAGTLVGGLILIPAIGIKHTIEVGVGLNAVMALLVFSSREAIAKAYRLAAWIALLITGTTYVVLAPDWSKSVMLSGVFRMINTNNTPAKTFSSFKGMYTDDVRLYYKEGRSATVAVVLSGANREEVLVVNGKADASSQGDLTSQTLVGMLSVLFHPNPDTVFVVGLGSGVTLGSVLTDDVKYADCAEISPEVVEASWFFNGINHRPLEDPRAHLYIDDALSFLKLTSRRYKVIVSEPTNPWIAGVGNLFTTEFLNLCRERLTDGGIMTQWFHVYEMDDQTVRLALRTFRSAFPYVTAWQPVMGDVVLIGSTRPLDPQFESIRAKLQNERIKNDLARIHINNLTTLLSLQVMTQRSIDEYVGPGSLNTEDRPLLEYWAPHAFFVNRGAQQFLSRDERMGFGNEQLYLNQYRKTHPLTDDEWLQIASLQRGRWGNQHVSYALLAAYCKDHPDSVDALSKLADVTESLGRRQEALVYDKRLAELNKGDALSQEHYAWYKLVSNWTVMSPYVPFDGTEEEALLKRSIALADTVDRPCVRLGEYYYRVHRYREAEESFRRALTIRQTHASDTSIPQDELLLRLARAVYRQGRMDEAKAYSAQALLENPESQDGRDFLDFLMDSDFSQHVTASE